MLQNGESVGAVASSQKVSESVNKREERFLLNLFIQKRFGGLLEVLDGCTESLQAL